MLVQGDREVYFVDRDNSVFQVNGLTFPHVRDITRCLRDTLLDGVCTRIIATTHYNYTYYREFSD